MIGQKYGKWTVVSGIIRQTIKDKNVNFHECNCECGTVKLVRRDDLTQSKSTQCKRCSSNAIDISLYIGKKFGKWTIISKVDVTKEEKIRRKNRIHLLLCKCECGTLKPVRFDGLLSGKSTQCLACKKQAIDIESFIGKKFGKWTVLEITKRPKIAGSLLLCQCECGNKSAIRATHLRDGYNQCRDCYAVERISRLTTHGLTQKKEYKVWLTMKTRCNNEKRKQYKWYGARGIKVCDRWLNSFKNFYEDMGPRPDGYQIDRTNNDKGYSPDNCKWVSPKENNDNRRNSKKNKIPQAQLTIAYPD